MKLFIFRNIIIVIILFFIILLITSFFVQGSIVYDKSMEPHFQEGDFILILKKSSKENVTYQRGEIVFFKAKDKNYYLKRLIGLPGERLKIGENKIIIYNESNPEGFKLDESTYLGKQIPTCIGYRKIDGKAFCTGSEISLGRDEYYIMGDNRLFSRDSRIMGPIEKDDIIGKFWIRLWPAR